MRQSLGRSKGSNKNKTLSFDEKFEYEGGKAGGKTCIEEKSDVFGANGAEYAAEGRQRRAQEESEIGQGHEPKEGGKTRTKGTNSTLKGPKPRR